MREDLMVGEINSLIPRAVRLAYLLMFSERVHPGAARLPLREEFLSQIDLLLIIKLRVTAKI